jgi:hypothetical protein
MDNLVQAYPDAARDFIRLCLVSNWDPGASRELVTLLGTGSVNWQEVVQLSTEMSLGPSVYLAVKDLPGIPVDTREVFLRQYLDSGVNVALLSKELATLLSILNDYRIDVILLKGIGLVHQIYDNPAVRPMQDMDILIDRERVSQALEILQDHGYSLVKTDLREGFTLAYENEVVLRKPGLYVLLLDLHWYLFDSPYYQTGAAISWFKDATNLIPVGNATARVFSLEAQIIYLSGHLSLHHSANEWIWLRDLAYLISHNLESIRWPLVIEKARELELILPLQRTLPILAKEWRVAIPGQVLDEIESLVPSTREIEIANRLTLQERGAGRRFLDDIHAFDRPADAIRFVFYRLFPSPTYMVNRYQIRHKILLPGYYLYRWYLGIRSSL